MARLRDTIASGALGAASGLAGVVALSRCSGSCASCGGCLGAGLGIVLLALLHRTRQPPRKQPADAPA